MRFLIQSNSPDVPTQVHADALSINDGTLMFFKTEEVEEDGTTESHPVGLILAVNPHAWITVEENPEASDV